MLRKTRFGCALCSNRFLFPQAASSWMPVGPAGQKARTCSRGLGSGSLFGWDYLASEAAWEGCTPSSPDCRAAFFFSLSGEGMTMALIKAATATANPPPSTGVRAAVGHQKPAGQHHQHRQPQQQVGEVFLHALSPFVVEIPFSRGKPSAPQGFFE